MLGMFQGVTTELDGLLDNKAIEAVLPLSMRRANSTPSGQPVGPEVYETPLDAG